MGPMEIGSNTTRLPDSILTSPNLKDLDVQRNTFSLSDKDRCKEIEQMEHDVRDEGVVVFQFEYSGQSSESFFFPLLIM